MNAKTGFLGSLFPRIALFLLCILAAFPFCGGSTPLQAVAANSVSCKPINTPNDIVAKKITSLATIEEGYHCILSHYVNRKVLNSRVLLQNTYSSMLKELQQVGMQITANPLTGLTGNIDRDWEIFSEAYNHLLTGLPKTSAIQEALAQLALDQMAAGLKDDHTQYLPNEAMKLVVTQLDGTGVIPSFGVLTSPLTPTASLWITYVFPQSPAALAGLKAGDAIVRINGSSIWNHNEANAGLLHFALPQIGTAVNLVLYRSQTNSTFTVTLSPRPLALPDTISQLIHNRVAYIRLPSFTKNAAKSVFSAIKKLGPGVQGVVLDLRGNDGGYADQAIQLLSAFIHHATLGATIDQDGKRDLLRSDDTVALLHLPLAVLIDQGSASSSELVASGVRNLRLGTVIGETSSGALGGAEFYGLSDGSGLEITEALILGAKNERIDGAGVTPDMHSVTTARDLSLGKDTALDLAIHAIETYSTSI